MARPSVGPRFVLRLPHDQRAAVEQVVAPRRQAGQRRSACTPAAVIRDLLDTQLSELRTHQRVAS